MMDVAWGSYGGRKRRRAGLKTSKLLPAREGEIGWCASHFVVVNDLHPGTCRRLELNFRTAKIPATVTLPRTCDALHFLRFKFDIIVFHINAIPTNGQKYHLELMPSCCTYQERIYDYRNVRSPGRMGTPGGRRWRSNPTDDPGAARKCG